MCRKDSRCLTTVADSKPQFPTGPGTAPVSSGGAIYSHFTLLEFKEGKLQLRCRTTSVSGLVSAANGHTQHFAELQIRSSVVLCSVLTGCLLRSCIFEEGLIVARLRTFLPRKFFLKLRRQAQTSSLLGQEHCRRSSEPMPRLYDPAVVGILTA
jgi:hypothetical protein